MYFFLNLLFVFEDNDKLWTSFKNNIFHMYMNACLLLMQIHIFIIKFKCIILGSNSDSTGQRIP